MLPNTIQISTSGERFSFLKNLKKGEEVKAQIVEHQGNSRALIEIKGRRFTADFVNGVPGSKHVIFELKDSYDGSAVFQIRQDLDYSNLSSLLRYFSFGLSEKISYTLTGKLRELIDKKGFSLLELGKLILEIEGNRNHSQQLLHQLQYIGADDKLLRLISLILLHARLGSSGIYIVFALLGKEKRDLKYITELQKEADFNSSLNTFFLNLLDKDQKSAAELINSFFKYIATPLHEQAFSSEAMYFFEDGTFKELNFIKTSEKVLLSVNFSTLGCIEVSASLNGNRIDLIVLCENEDALSLLLDRRDDIIERLMYCSIKANIHILSVKNAKEVFKNAFSSYSQGAGLDIKI